MKFTDKLKKHESERADIVSTIDRFCDYLCEVGEEMDINYRLWSKDYHSEYLNHFLRSDDTIIVNFEYIDPYDDILDSQDTLIFPIEWLDKDKDILLSLIQKEYTEYDQQITDQEKRRLETTAKVLGYKLMDGDYVI